jgi:hypothetical protein
MTRSAWQSLAIPWLSPEPAGRVFEMSRLVQQPLGKSTGRLGHGGAPRSTLTGLTSQPSSCVAQESRIGVSRVCIA